MQEVIIIAASVLSLIVSAAVLIIISKKIIIKAKVLRQMRLSVPYEMNLQHSKAY